jgi:hypothetical protein
MGRRLVRGKRAALLSQNVLSRWVWRFPPLLGRGVLFEDLAFVCK